MIIILLASFYGFLFNPQYLVSANKRIYDLFFTKRGEQAHDSRIIIVDIDEKSLKNLGQWPWPRYQFAKILDNLTEANVAIIGLDIVFAEEDQSSPSKIFLAWL